MRRAILFQLHSKSHSHQPQRPMLYVLIALVGLILTATIFLTGCGGPEAQQVPGGEGISTVGVSIPTTQVSSPGDETDQAIQDAVESYIRSNIVSTPYKDVSVRVLDKDDAFATAEVHALLRMSESEDWQEHVATYKLKSVGGTWRVDQAGSFISALAPQMTAIALSEQQRTAYIKDIFMLSATEGWAIGYGSPLGQDVGTVVLHYANGAWEQKDYFPTYHLESLYMVSPQEGWAVGAGTRPGADNIRVMIMLHYKDGEWQDAKIAPAAAGLASLSSVYMVSEQEGWAVGIGDGQGSSPVLHYKDGLWSLAEVLWPEDASGSLLDMRGLHVVSAQEGWAAGKGQMLHLENGAWKVAMERVLGSSWEYKKPARGLTLKSVSMLSADEGWAVGEETLLHYQDGEWTAVERPDPFTRKEETHLYEDVQAVSADDVWAVGAKYRGGDIDNRQGLIMHYTGGQWQAVDAPTVEISLDTLSMVSPEEGWAAGFGGVILHYQGGKWTLYNR
jgi:photosystem II stability/assembly factor-like uncharacterized protein